MLKFVVNAEQQNKRLDVFLSEKNTELSRSNIQRLIEEKKDNKKKWLNKKGIWSLQNYIN